MLLEIMLDERYQEGKVEGRIEGKIEDILELLEEFGSIPAELSAFISNEKNPDILQDWLKKVSKSTSMEQFMDSISFSTIK